MTHKIQLDLAPKKTGKTKFSFIMNYDYKAAASFTKIGGKAGGPIYNYLKRYFILMNILQKKNAQPSLRRAHHEFQDWTKYNKFKKGVYY